MNLSKTVLVTGVAGFLGRYIARYFNQQGWSVIGISNAPPENAPVASLAAYYSMHLPHAELGALLQQYKPEVCIHCAGRASVGLSMSDPAADFHSGAALTFEVLNALRLNAPDCRFVFLSSAAVYGNPASLPVVETQSLAPLSPYGFHKSQSEQLCLEFAKVYGLSTASARIFSAYGPGLRRQVIWDICQKAIEQDTLVLQGTGQESRDFIHALDIAKAIEQIIQTGSMMGESYNLATGREVTILELANLILEVLEVDHSPQFDSVVPTGSPLNWRADVSKLQALGFVPSVPFERGIQTFAYWCRAELLGV